MALQCLKRACHGSHAAGSSTQPRPSVPPVGICLFRNSCNCMAWHSSAARCQAFKAGSKAVDKTFKYYASNEFQPRLLTHRIQQAQQVEQLQELWQRHQQQFNSIHFSALVQQLAVLHGREKAHMQQPDHNQGYSGMRAVGQHSFSTATTAAAATTGAAAAGDDPYHGSHGECLELNRCSYDTPDEGESDDKLATVQQLEQQAQCQEAVTGAAAAGVQAFNALQIQAQQQDVTALQQHQQPQQSHLHQQQHEQPYPAQQQQHRAVQLSLQQFAQPVPQQQTAQQLAHLVAAAALQPDTLAILDNRALVMVCFHLAKVGLQDSQLLAAVVQAADQQVLQQLDPQQLTNLIWSVAVGADSLKAVVSSASSSSSSMTGISSSSGRSSSSNQYQPHSAWLRAAEVALQSLLPRCNSSAVSMALWGFGQLGHAPSDAWWAAFYTSTQHRLMVFSGHELAIVMYACGKLKIKVPECWLASWLAACCDALPSFSPQHLTMCMWGLAASGNRPDKAWLLAWFLTSRNLMQLAGTQDLSLWLYSLALLHLTPSPVWRTSYVEASYERLTAPSTPPQELVNTMWAISRLDWSPPMLYWRGLLGAACSKFSSFNPQDLANCITAANTVDVSSIPKPWLKAFIKASEGKLSVFQPVQLAHTAFALAGIARAHTWANLCIHSAWQTAFVVAATGQLTQGRFSARNLQLVVKGIRQLQFKSAASEVQAFLRMADVALGSIKTHQQLQQRLQQQPSSELSQQQQVQQTVHLAAAKTQVVSGKAVVANSQQY